MTTQTLFRDKIRKTLNYITSKHSNFIIINITTDTKDGRDGIWYRLYNNGKKRLIFTPFII